MNLDDEPPVIIDDADIDDAAVIDDDQQDDEPSVSFGDEPEEDDTEAPNALRQMREELKERQRKIIAIERENEELRKKTAPAPVEVGPRPKLEEFDYDEDKHNAALDQYEDRKVQAALQKQTAAADNGLVEEAQADVAKFQASVSALTFPDAKAIIASVGETMPAEMQYAVAATAIDPATFIYALGKHPAKLQELLAIKNPTKQIAAIVRMEASMKVGNSRKPPEPDRPQRGNASAAPKTDKELARLHKSAQESGDYSAYLEYKRKLAA